MNPLNLVTVHHEGAGDPSNVARGSGGGYSYWIGATGWTRLRSPFVSWATLNFNHVSVDVCLSGDRDVWPVTPYDIAWLTQIAADARGRGEMSNYPLVRPHKLSPGSNTVCPGTDTFADWPQVAHSFVNAGPNVPPPAPPSPPNGRPTIAAGAFGPTVTQLQHELNVGCGQFVATDGAFGPNTRGLHVDRCCPHPGRRSTAVTRPRAADKKP